jgi:HD-GYP domain-containing protein (c-di-GMP phosphodiesterase class II)
MSPTLDPGMEMAVRLRLVCEAHDASIGRHLDRVTRYACEIGRLLGLPAATLNELYHAVPLHDLGKIGVPLELLNKPGRLTPEEMDLVKSHTAIGHRILDGSASPLLQCAARIALSHHENWDGTGYPHRRAGAEIPFDVRITSIADVYDALNSPRAYKPAWELDQVIDEMRQQRGKKFDPAILDLFLDHLPSMAEISA